MRLANVDGRAVVVTEGGGVDVAEASGGQFGPAVQPLYADWAAFRAFADSLGTGQRRVEVDERLLRSPVPHPAQVFGIGLNYRSHAEETGAILPSVPATFTKFPASLSGPFDDVPLAGSTVDWEVELVVVLGARADRVAAGGAWSHVAGLAVGQDISERTVQRAAGNQFCLGKSYRGFGPIGPWLVTPDEFDDPDDLALTCSLDGEKVQDGRTNDLVFDVPHLIEALSNVVPLLPGDVIFTGTPAGVGVARTPARYLQVGEMIESWIEGIGTIRNRCVAGS